LNEERKKYKDYDHDELETVGGLSVTLRVEFSTSDHQLLSVDEFIRCILVRRCVGRTRMKLPRFRSWTSTVPV